MAMGGWPPVLALGAFKALLILCTLLAPSQAVVRAVLDNNSSMVDFADLQALFGVPLAPEGVRGYLMEAKPANACQPIQGPWLGNGSLGAIVLIRRYDCTFDVKVLHAQQAGFKVAIIHNVGSDDLVRMTHFSEDLQHQITIPSVFVSESTSRNLRVIVRCGKSAHVLLLPNYRLRPHLDFHPVLALSWVLGSTLLTSTILILPIWLCAWWTCRPVVKTQAHQKAQVHTFTRRHDVCAICLEKYKEGDQLKILPCCHVYHCKCIDPWFSRASQHTCPVCKQSVASTEDDTSDSPVKSFADEDLLFPGSRPPIWAIQAQLCSRRL